MKKRRRTVLQSESEKSGSRCGQANNNKTATAPHVHVILCFCLQCAAIECGVSVLICNGRFNRAEQLLSALYKSTAHPNESQAHIRMKCNMSRCLDGDWARTCLHKAQGNDTNVYWKCITLLDYFTHLAICHFTENPKLTKSNNHKRLCWDSHYLLWICTSDGKSHTSARIQEGNKLNENSNYFLRM